MRMNIKYRRLKGTRDLMLEEVERWLATPRFWRNQIHPQDLEDVIDALSKAVREKIQPTPNTADPYVSVAGANADAAAVLSERRIGSSSSSEADRGAGSECASARNTVSASESGSGGAAGGSGHLTTESGKAWCTPSTTTRTRYMPVATFSPTRLMPVQNPSPAVTRSAFHQIVQTFNNGTVGASAAPSGNVSDGARTSGQVAATSCIPTSGAITW